jgi:hypothetical protein
MVPQNLAQHAQLLKLLEQSIREICDDHKLINDLVRESWTKTMKLFLIADDLRKCSLDSSAQKILG